MKPSGISPEEVPVNASVVRIEAPAGRADIEGVDALVMQDQQGGPQMVLRIALEEGDLERLAATGHWWLAMLSDHMHPVAFVLPRSVPSPILVPPGVAELASLRAELDQERARIRELLMLALIQADALASVVEWAWGVVPARRLGRRLELQLRAESALELTRELIAPGGTG